MNQKSQTPQNTAPPEQELIKKLLDFYWEILKDTDLKPADRIASAKRLEALLTAQNNQEASNVFVSLHLPEGCVQRGEHPKNLDVATP
mgnify:CR=1 FL=1